MSKKQHNKTMVRVNKDSSISSIITSINTHSKKYEKYLKDVEKNMTVLKTTEVSRQTRLELKRALESISDLEAESVKFDAKPFPNISKFLQRLHQFFKGRGFNTKREYGLKIADKLTEIDKNIWKQELKDYLIGETVDFKAMMEAIKKIPYRDFDEFLQIYVETNPSFAEKHRKLKIFKNLEVFQQETIRDKWINENWYIPIYNILKGASKEEMNEFISEAMISSVISSPKDFLQSYSDQNDFIQIAEVIMERISQSDDPKAKEIIRYFRKD